MSETGLNTDVIERYVFAQFSAARVKLFVWIASYSLVVFDYIFTLDKEVKYVWSCPWTIGLVLFYLNRYLPVVDIVLFFQVFLYSSTTPTACSAVTRLSLWFILIAILISQTIIILRTYAIWGCRRLIFWILAPATVFSFTFSVALSLYLSLTPNHPTTLDNLAMSNASLQNKCLVSSLPLSKQNSMALVVGFVLFFAGETVIIGLTAFKAREHIQKVSSSWVTQLYRNGFLYCICMLALTAINAVVLILAPASLKLTGFPMQRALYSVFCNRVVFLILQHRTRVSEDGGSSSRRRPATYTDSTMDVFTSIQLDTDGGVDPVASIIPWQERAQREWLR